MSGVVKINEGDITYEAVVANVVGGNVVQFDATATESGAVGCKPAAADSITALGVANKDAVTAANRDALTSGTGPAPLSAFVTDASVPSATVTAYNDCWTTVVAAAGTAIAYRQGLKCAANGTVTLWVDGTDSPGKRIGWCAQPGGIGTGGGPIKARILI